MDPSKREAIVVEFERGDAVSVICERHGVSRGHVYRLASDRGVRRTTIRIQGSERLAVKRRYLAGESLKGIAHTYDCDPVTVRNVLLALEVELRAPVRPTRDISDEHKRKIVELYDAGVRQAEIVRQLDLPQHRVSKYLISTGRRRQRQGSRYRGGRVTNKQGYVSVLMAWDHPFAETMRNSMGYVPEHRLVMAEALGRPLRKHETVHHINGDRGDNRLVNLQLRFGNHGKGVLLKCGDCGSVNVEPQPLD